MIGHMLKIFRNVVFTDEKAPAGCSLVAKDLPNSIPSTSNPKLKNFNANPNIFLTNLGFGDLGGLGVKKNTKIFSREGVARFAQ